ncbi:MAG TPA: CDP-glucose 4,6-dehydratase [Thermoanaerobaculia bacterium]|nr:CDP-glucose 4,6-dehydratase [Thermoanaerobaculia bacterium]
MGERQSSLETLVLSSSFWSGKRVLLTGHTGFKGSWLAMWLTSRGASVTGFALPPPYEPSLFRTVDLASSIESIEGDVRDLDALKRVVRSSKPQIVFHLAAQALVRASYESPVETYATNVMGTVHLLESVRQCEDTRAVVIVTSDKCYENREWVWGYREEDPMGGHDPYSNSKGCSELVTAAYSKSFFNGSPAASSARVASARAGNVIGGGDWAKDRLIPDIIEAFSQQSPVVIRSPKAVRPWQHVLEPLSGYVLLAEKLWEGGEDYTGGWNFGPSDADARPVDWIVERLRTIWGDGASWKLDGKQHPHEAHLLKLDISKARSLLRWRPRLELGTALEWTAVWYREFLRDSGSARQMTERQIADFERIGLTRDIEDESGALSAVDETSRNLS